LRKSHEIGHRLQRHGIQQNSCPDESTKSGKTKALAETQVLHQHELTRQDQLGLVHHDPGHFQLLPDSDGCCLPAARIRYRSVLADQRTSRFLLFLGHPGQFSHVFHGLGNRRRKQQFQKNGPPIPKRPIHRRPSRHYPLRHHGLNPHHRGVQCRLLQNPWRDEAGTSDAPE